MVLFEVNMGTERHFLEENPCQRLPAICWAPCGFSSTAKQDLNFRGWSAIANKRQRQLSELTQNTQGLL